MMGIMRRIVLLAGLLGLVSPACAAGAGWTHLKAGMAQAETFQLLGKPLIQTRGRGFEVWIYDNNAEAVFYRGPLVAWTAPTGGDSASAQSPQEDISLQPAFLSAPRPVMPARPQDSGGDGEALPSTHFRYQQRR